MQDVLILGAGGHAQVVADILMRAHVAGSQLRPIGYLDDDPELHGRLMLHLPVLGPIAHLPNVAHDAVVAAIGDNRTRQQLFARLRHQGERFAVAQHPTAVIAPDVSVGHGTIIAAGVVVNPGAMIGTNVILNTSCSVDHHNHLYDHVHVAPGAHLGGAVSIGEGTLVGIGATIMPQRTIGAWSIVGAGAVVHHDVPEGVVVVGVPARIIRHNNER